MILRLRQSLFRMAVVTACWFLLPSSPAHAAWWTLDLPGAPARFEQLAGLPPGTPRAQWLTRLVRLANEPVGENAPDIVTVRARLLQALETAPAGGAETARTRLPLPVPFETWKRALDLDRDATHVDLLRLLLVDRRVGLLYHGLVALDDETRAALADRPDLLRSLWRRASGAFGAFGPALRLSGGRVVTPGGAAFTAVWERVVDRHVGEPDEFIERLFRADRGALAYVYATMAEIDAARLRFAMGDPSTQALKEAANRIRTLVSLVRSRHPEWDIEARPFQRPSVDLERVLAGLALDANGRVAGPMADRFWRDVFSASLPGRGRTEDWRRDVAEAPPLDLQGLVNLVIQAEGTTALRRWDAFQFVQRRFAAASDAPLDEVAWAALGVLESPALIFTLEQLGVVDATVYATATRRARQLVGTRSLPALAQLQAILATLSYGRWSGSLSEARTRQWAAEVIAFVPADAAYQGRLATWFDEAVSAELPDESSNGEEFNVPEAEELRIVRWLTNAGGAGARDELTWDGERYRIDPGAGELDRIRAVRRRQPGPTLTAALNLLRALRGAATAPFVARAMVADDVRAAGETLPERLAERFGGGRPAAATAQLADRIGKMSANRWQVEVRDAARTLAPLVDAAFTEALVALVYAMHLGRSDGPISLAPDLASRHSWVVGEIGRDERDVWRWPREVVGSEVGWHVTGSLLGLDVAVGRLRLPELAIERVSSQPRVNANDRRTLALGAALLSPSGPSDALRDAVAAAIDRGRQQLRGLSGMTPDERAGVGHAAAWSAWRLNEVAWSSEHDVEALDALHTVADAFWVGVGGSLPPGISPAGWAGPRTPADGRLALEVRPPVPWEKQMGRPGTGMLTATFLDPALRALEWLAERGYPGRLAGPLVGALVVEVVYAAPLTHAEDVLAMAAVVKHASPDELDDMMGQLVVDGYLRLADLDIVGDEAQSEDPQR